MTDNRRFLIVFLILFSLLNATVFAVPLYEINYIKGDIKQKTQAVIDAGDQGDLTLSVKAIDFAIAVHEVLGDDPDLVSLLQVAIQTIGIDPQKGQIPGLSEKLAEVFKTFQSDAIRVAALDRITLFPSTESITLINSYISNCAIQKAAMTPVLLKAINTIGRIGNGSSFSLLFAIVLDDIWPPYSNQIEYSLGYLANRSEKEILSVYGSATLDKKLRIVQIVSKNENIVQNIKGDVAQNALAESITNVGNITNEQINIQVISVQAIADTHWTRAAFLVTDFFKVAKKEYENGLLPEDQFAQIILNAASVASTDTCQILSSYLDSLNKDMEKGKVPSKQVILATIRALGGLGDKTAFDYLLYVTYLDYPEDVISSARDALAKLKW